MSILNNAIENQDAVARCFIDGMKIHSNKENVVRKGACSLLLAACSLFGPYVAHSSELHAETEAERLERVREIIKAEQRREPLEYVPRPNNSTAPSCEVMLDDLMKGKGFSAIEPIAVFDHEYPSWNMRLSYFPPPDQLKQAEEDAKLLGPLLAASLQRCSLAEAEGNEERAKALFLGLDEWVGKPPFRLYVLPDWLTPFSSSNFLYWSEYGEELGHGREGYSWVDMDSCEHVGGIQALTQSKFLLDDPLGQQAALAVYKNHLVAWKVSRGYMFALDYYENRSDLISDEAVSRNRTLCAWASYQK